MSKQICAPNNSYKYTCFSIKSLQNIAKKLNNDDRFSTYKDINVKKYNKNNKKKFVNEIQKKLSCNGKLDFCILEKENEFYNEIKSTMKPKGPGGKEWLSTIDIADVMKQYEKKYKDFIFFGPVPMDFLEIYKELANINIKSLCKNKKRIGIVFNTDTSQESGEHWISLFVDLKDRTICFFDSVGDRPPKPVRTLINNIVKQCKVIDKPLKVVINTKQHQFKNSECGIYSLFHIISRLRGKSCSYIYNKVIKDEEMSKYRKKFFR